MTRRRIVPALGAAGATALLVTAGCSATPGDGVGSGTPSATVSTLSATASSPPSGPTATASPTDGTPESSTTPDAGATSIPPDESGSTPRCLTPDLAGSLEAVPGGGSAGHYELRIVLENEGPERCVLQGWPGVSFVGGDDGAQLGASATLDRSSPHDPVPLAPGAAAQASVLVANADNYGEGCGRTAADGLRVYPPGETRSLFVRNDELRLLACTNPHDELLEVQAFQPES